MALGAAPGQLLRQVVRSGMLPVVTGAVAGILRPSVSRGPFVDSCMRRAPTDALSLTAAASTVLLADVFAALVPAWRAATLAR